MHYAYTRRSGARSPVTDAATFRVDRLSRAPDDGAPAADISDLIDRTYEYHSPRELRWHLAQRLGLPATALRLEAL